MKMIVTLKRSAVAALAAIGAAVPSTAALATGNVPDCYPETCECVFLPNGVVLCTTDKEYD